MAPPGMFEAFREKGAPTYYGEQHVPSIADTKIVVILFFCCLCVAACLLVVLGVRGKERISVFLRLLNVLAIGISIIIVIIGQRWQEGNVESLCPYRLTAAGSMNARMSINLGLTCVNITLSDTRNDKKSMLERDIYFNERLHWDGETTDSFRVEYLEVLKKGMPSPIVSIAEYMTIDQGRLSWGRQYRAAGYFATYLLWSAFACWVLTSVLLCTVVFYGAIWAVATGVTLGATAIMYHLMQPSIPLNIPFENGNLILHYGWHFWLVVVTAGWTTLLGTVLAICESCIPDEINTFFNIEKKVDFTDDDNYKHNFILKSNKNSNSMPSLVCYENFGFDPDEKSDTTFKQRTRSLSEGSNSDNTQPCPTPTRRYYTRKESFSSIFAAEAKSSPQRSIKSTSSDETLY